MTTSVSKYLLSTSQKNEDEADAKLSHVPARSEEAPPRFARRHARFDERSGAGQPARSGRKQRGQRVRDAPGRRRQRRLRPRLRPEPPFAGTGRPVRDRRSTQAHRTRHLRHLRDVRQADQQRTLGGYSLHALHGGMPVSDRASEQGAACPPVGDQPLRFDGREENDDTEEEEFTPESKE